MEINNKMLTRFGVITLFILLPTVSLPIIFTEIYNKKKYPLFLLAIYMGLLSMYYFPWGDQYRYMNYLTDYKYLHFKDVFDFSKVLIFRDLNIINILLFYAAKCNFTIELFRFSLVTYSYVLILSIFRNFDSDNKLSLKSRFLCFLILFLAVPFYHICYGYRTGIAICFFVYGIYKLGKGEYKGYAYLIIAAFTHYFFVLEILIYLVANNLRRYISIKTIAVLVVFLLLLTLLIINILYGKNSFIDIIIDLYIKGEHGLESSKSLKEVISTMLINGFVVAILFVIFLLGNYKGKFENLLYLNLCILLISIPFPTINERILALSVLLLTVYFLSNKLTRLISKVIILLPFMFISLVYPYWKHRDIYALTQIIEIVYKPLPLILQHNVPENEVNKYIDYKGEYAKSKSE
ncbi:MAG: hypothetical protein IJZ86_03470 [Bacteroides sp.]|nr:hypothetical protein [Bacteroides sp.]